MCGIIAYISRKGGGADREALAEAGRLMAHRGPDAHGLFTQGWLGLLHNRLSIIDLSSGANQPMFSPDKRYAIVYNGEIYNYKELREELAARGARFTTQSDTEVLLNSYIEYSNGCLDKLRGMFAFVIADLKKGEVFAARDSFGIKPLCIYKDDDRIILSSEIKPLSRFVQLGPDYDNYLEMIMFRDTAGPRTFYKDIYKLRPGHYYVYKKGADTFEERAYHSWDETFRRENRFRGMSEDDIIAETEEVLAESVKVHTYSDVGYNLQLSGGTDSSVIAALLARRLNCANLKSYSITLGDRECDESPYQKIAADSLGIDNRSFEMSNEIFTENLEKATYYLEKPVMHFGSVCLYYLTQHSAVDSKVILTGEGADEAFGGYSEYGSSMKAGILMALHRLHLHKVMYPFRGVSEKMRRVYVKLWENQLLRRTSFIKWHEVERILREEHLSNRCFDQREAFLENGPRKDVRGRMFYYNLHTQIHTLLDRQDKMSMANSVEARVPYTDRRVFELANSIPMPVKLKGGRLKYILKEIAAKYLPAELIHRRKNGLNLPIRRWLMDKRLLGRYLEILFDDTTRKRGIYDIGYIREMVKGHEDGDTDMSKRLAYLSFFELWHRIFFDGGL